MELLWDIEKKPISCIRLRANTEKIKIGSIITQYPLKMFIQALDNIFMELIWNGKGVYIEG